MYKCKNCNSIDKFELMFDENYKGNRNFAQKYNNRHQIEITIDGHTFIPSLDFMNKHAVCKYCGQIYIWDYD
ncbi:hypothetical protein IKE67_01300 [bacterium]|nr:hypothetical protein [bacterium]